MMQRRVVTALTLLIVGLAIIFAGQVFLSQRQANAPVAYIYGPAHPDGVVGLSDRASALQTGFTLTDQNGALFSTADIKGRVAVIYFGFTQCPDVCAPSLVLIGQALARLSMEERAQVQPIFISLDPARDTPTQISAFLQHFDTAFIGLTGTEEEIAHVAQGYRVSYQLNPPNDYGFYTVDHSSFTYVLDRQGNLATALPHGSTASDMETVLRRLIAE